MHSQGSAPCDGIVVASGYGLKLYVERGHLAVHDGIGRKRGTRRFNRATSGLKRVMVLGHSGFVTLEALRWIRDVRATFAQIDADGKLVAISAAERFHNEKLRRAQVLASGTEAGRAAVLDQLRAKIEHQARVADRLAHLRPTLKTDGKRREVSVAQAIRERLVELESADTLAQIRKVESAAGRYYWQTWARVPVGFTGAWRRSVPEHWKIAGPRYPAKQSRARPDGAITPAHALINYSYAILEVEATIALHRLGLDPSLGLMHTDRRYRASLASDLMEAARPASDELVLDLIDRRQLRREDIHETRRGTCRLGPPLARELAAHGPALRDAIAPHAERLARTLVRAPDLPTPLTRSRWSRSAGSSSR